MNQVIYYIYKTENHIEEHSKKLNNTDIFPTEGRQLTNITKDDEVKQDSLNSGEEDGYCSFYEESCGNKNET